jgi:hypothetical protein
MKLKINIGKKYKNQRVIGLKDFSYWAGMLTALVLGDLLSSLIFVYLYPNKILFVIFGLIFSLLILNKTVSLFAGEQVAPVVEIR